MPQHVFVVQDPLFENNRPEITVESWRSPEGRFGWRWSASGDAGIGFVHEGESRDALHRREAKALDAARWDVLLTIAQVEAARNASGIHAPLFEEQLAKWV